MEEKMKFTLAAIFAVSVQSVQVGQWSMPMSQYQAQVASEVVVDSHAEVEIDSECPGSWAQIDAECPGSWA